VNSDIETLAAISAGYRRGHDRLEELRIRDIQNSNTESALRSFDLIYKTTRKHPVERKTVGLTKLQRVLFGIDK